MIKITEDGAIVYKDYHLAKIIQLIYPAPSNSSSVADGYITFKLSFENSYLFHEDPLEIYTKTTTPISPLTEEDCSYVRSKVLLIIKQKIQDLFRVNRDSTSYMLDILIDEKSSTDVDSHPLEIVVLESEDKVIFVKLHDDKTLAYVMDNGTTTTLDFRVSDLDYVQKLGSVTIDSSSTLDESISNIIKVVKSTINTTSENLKELSGCVKTYNIRKC